MTSVSRPPSSVLIRNRFVPEIDLADLVPKVVRTNMTGAYNRRILAARSTGSGWIVFLAHFLFILVAWTLVIKYLFPMAYSLAYGEPLTRYIYWDLWPVAHIWLGWALLAWQRYTVWLAIVMAAVEIVVIVTLFSFFLAEPDWSIWRTNWFINKIFVLLCFFLILGTFTVGRRAVVEPHEAALRTKS